MAIWVISSRGVRRDLTFLSIQIRNFSKQANSVKNEKPVFLVNRQWRLKRLEEQGVPSKKFKAITPTITNFRNDGLKNMSPSFVSNPMENNYSLQECKDEMLESDMRRLLEEIRYFRKLRKKNAESFNRDMESLQNRMSIDAKEPIDRELLKRRILFTRKMLKQMNFMMRQSVPR